MQTFPCGHKVVCRKCLIKTIQVAVSKRCLPLRCVVCRDRILRLQNVTQYHLGTCGSTVVNSPSLPSTLIPAALPGSRPAPSHVALTYTFHSTRPSPSTLSPTSPTNVFSLVSTPRYHSSFSRLLSPVGSGVNCLPRLRSSMSVPNNVPRMTHLVQSSLEEEFLRCTPDDSKSLLRSDNEATNINRTTDFEDRADTPAGNRSTTSQHSRAGAPLELRSTTSQPSRSGAPLELRSTTSQPSRAGAPLELRSTIPNTHRASYEIRNGANTPEKSRSPTPQLNKMTTVQKIRSPNEQDNIFLHKQNGQYQTSNMRKLDTPSHNFKHAQSAKIHPTSNDHLNSFMDSPEEHGASSAALPARVSSNSPQNSVSASKFLARLFPKSSRRKCNWFRTE